eukprot:10345746-Alexandrium_andersonii.AAC.1
MVRVATSSVTVEQGMQAAPLLVKPAGLRRRVPTPARSAPSVSRQDAARCKLAITTQYLNIGRSAGVRA